MLPRSQLLIHFSSGRTKNRRHKLNSSRLARVRYRQELLLIMVAHQRLSIQSHRLVRLQAALQEEEVSMISLSHASTTLKERSRFRSSSKPPTMPLLMMEIFISSLFQRQEEGKKHQVARMEATTRLKKGKTPTMTYLIDSNRQS